MEAVIYLDTHVVGWLYRLDPKSARLTLRAREAIESGADLRMSPMVRLELQYLFEIGRIAEPPLLVLDAIQGPLGLTICDAPFPAVVREAEKQEWTRDPFDRMIVAQAALHDAALITADERMHANYGRCIW